MKMRILYFVALGMSLFSCNAENNKNEITHPLTVKGMRLGLDAEQQIEIANKNNICENGFGTFELIRYDYDSNELTPIKGGNTCQYRLDDDIVVRPISNYGYLDKKKVLTKVTLLFHSPSKYPTVTSIFSEEDELDVGRPSVSWDQALVLMSLYEDKYGKGKGRNTKQWVCGDLCITMRIVEYTDIKEKGVCLCVVTYSYIKEIENQIVYEDLENSAI